MSNTHRPNRYQEKMVIRVTLIKKSKPNIGLDLKFMYLLFKKLFVTFIQCSNIIVCCI